MADKRTFTVDGHEQKYAVRVPTVEEIKKANAIRATSFNEALSRGDLLRDQLEGELRNRKLWNDKREAQYQTLRQEVLDGEFQLQKGGIRLSQARQIALEMSQKRDEMITLLSSRTDLDSNTCEGKADAARFNYLFACCLVYDETDAPYFPRNIDDYLLNQDDPVAVAGASEFYYLISGNDSIDQNLPENKFLHKFKFIDDKMRLIDKDGRLITDDGKHIDENGNFIKWEEDGTYTKVDPTGRAVNAAGDFDVEHSPFLDDEDKIIDESIYEKPKPKPKPKRGRKKTVKAEVPETSEEAVAESEN
tara:strand:- start:4240 stop:5154 length:915 start_codon:yes stop_codon:yes gene_type:complete